jgi:two-component system, OmpR family, response regulator
MHEKILIVDDDPEICELLRDYLQRSGFDPLTASDCQEAYRRFREERVDLIILDIMIPGTDGLTLCRDLRALSSVPVIMLTALAQEADRIVGLEMGADDYLVKPFSPRELLARVRALFRRTRPVPSPVGSTDCRLRFSGWVMDVRERRLSSPQGVVVSLSGAEYKLLDVLLEHANQVLSRDRLMDLLHGREAGPYDRSVDVLISRLRRRLGDTGRDPRFIKTVRNEGYVFCAKVEEAS